jgi:hypothetical protein
MVDGAPARRSCSGLQHLNVACRVCGTEAELRSGGRCWRCVLADFVDDLLTSPATGTISDQLAPLAAGLKAMARPNRGVTWIKQSHVKQTLRALAAAERVTHETLDEAPGRQQSKDYIRGLLVEYQALPPRDELLTRYDAWSAAAIARVTDPAHRDVLRRYVTWHHKRRLRGSPGLVAHGAFLRAKQQVTVAAELMNWLTDRGATLDGLSQTQLDHWRAEGPTTRAIANSFLGWAMKTQLTTTTLILPRRSDGTAPRMPALEQETLVAEVTTGTKLTTRDRAAAILIVVFAQQVENVAALTRDQVDVDPRARHHRARRYWDRDPATTRRTVPRACREQPQQHRIPPKQQLVLPRRRTRPAHNPSPAPRTTAPALQPPRSTPRHPP